MRTNFFLCLPHTMLLRVDAEITSHFCISSSGHLWPIFTHKILKRAVLFLRFCSLRSTQIRPKSAVLFLRFCSLRSTQIRPKSERQNANLFLRQPLLVKPVQGKIKALSGLYSTKNVSVSQLHGIFFMLSGLTSNTPPSSRMRQSLPKNATPNAATIRRGRNVSAS